MVYLFSKQDFNNYKTLISRGEIHNNFTFSTSEKIQIQPDNMKKMIKIKEKQKFTEFLNLYLIVFNYASGANLNTIPSISSFI